ERDYRSTSVMQFEGRILKRIGDTGTGERRPNRPRDHHVVKQRISSNNEAANQNIVPRLDQGASAYIPEFLNHRFESEKSWLADANVLLVPSGANLDRLPPVLSASIRFPAPSNAKPAGPLRPEAKTILVPSEANL